MILKDIVRYELPPEGITLLGYVVRRMHKTEWLERACEFLEADMTMKALDCIAQYAVLSSTSFGKAYYQPLFNRVGETVKENDPNTGAIVTATLESDSPHYHINYSAQMPNGGKFSGFEKITGTTVGLRGLGMPAPSSFNFQYGNYRADLSGLITSELALSIFGNTKIRAYGFLNFRDSADNFGKLMLSRDQKIQIEMGN